MAHSFSRNDEFQIISGPSLWDLMLGYFHSDLSHPHPVTFSLNSTNHPDTSYKVRVLLFGIFKDDNQNISHGFYGYLVSEKNKDNDPFNIRPLGYEVEGTYSPQYRSGNLKVMGEISEDGFFESETA
jgi:hypothetical protein